jgi:hypothetical protein
MKRMVGVAGAVAVLVLLLGIKAAPCLAKHTTRPALAAVSPPALATLEPLRPLNLENVDFEKIAIGRTYVDPGQIEPYGVVDQRTVRESRYTDPMHCPTLGVLSGQQVQAAWQACSDRFFNVDHSG